MSAHPDSQLMTAREVAAAFRVGGKRVNQWAQAGKISSARTPGGHLRYLRAEVEALLAGKPLSPAQLEAAWKALPEATQ